MCVPFPPILPSDVVPLLPIYCTSRTLQALKDKRCTIGPLLCEVACQLLQHIIHFANRLRIVVRKPIAKSARRILSRELSELSGPAFRNLIVQLFSRKSCEGDGPDPRDVGKGIPSSAV